MKVFVIVALLTLFTACHHVVSDSAVLSGSFAGYYHENYADTIIVSLDFKNNSFKKTTDKSLPGICTGTFKAFDETISFNDACANDNSLAHHGNLDGLYHFKEHDDGTLTIWKKDDSHIEEFILSAK